MIRETGARASATPAISECFGAARTRTQRAAKAPQQAPFVSDFVVVDGIAVGLLFSDGGDQLFCAASQSLQALENRRFNSAAEAQSFIADWLNDRVSTGSIGEHGRRGATRSTV